MRSGLAILLTVFVILTMIMAQAALCQEPGESFEKAPLIKLIPGEVAAPESGYYILNATRSQHCFKLDGLQPGYRLTIELEALGVEQGRAVISLYKESGELVSQRKIQYGSGTSEKIIMRYQPSLESAGEPQIHYLALGWYSGSLRYGLRLILEAVEDYAPGMGDAGSGPDSAIRLPDLSPEKPVELRGYLASVDDGGDFADHVDYYLIRVRFNSSKSILKIMVKPLGEMRISTSLYMGDRRIAYGSSREPGGEVKLEVSGQWSPGEDYAYTIRVDNLAERGGGAYEIRAWIEEPNATESQATQIRPPGGLSEQTLTMIIMAGAASLIAVSILMIFLRRKRLYRVEEVGWWGY